MILYHYTTKEAHDEIMTTGEFKPSDPWTTMDAAYGRGWYFTDIDPTKCESFIAFSCWTLAAFNRVRCYFKFEIDASLITKCSRDHVYVVSNWDSNKIKLVDHGENRLCGSRPHENCENYKKYF